MTKIAPRNDRLYILSQFLNATIFFIPIWIVYYQTKISLVEVSILVAVQYASQLFFELPTGAFADLFGRKTSIVLGYLLWAVFSILIILAPGFWLIALATVFAGLAESFLSGSLEAIVYDSHKQDGTENKFSEVLAKNNILFQFGLILGTVAGGFLYSIWYALPYILYAVLCAVAAAASLGMIEPKIDSETFSLRNYIKQMKEGTRHAFHNKRTIAISLYFVAVAGITWAVNLYFYDLALTQLIESDELRGIIGAGVRVVNVFILYMLLKQERIFTRQVSIWFFPAIMIIGYFGSWYFFDQLTLAIFFIALTVMAGSARWIILTRYTNECFDSKYRATAISVLSMLVGVIYVVITGISGYVMDLFAGVPSMFLILGVLSVLFVLPLAQINSVYAEPDALKKV